jgi:thioredoxin 1
MHVYNAEHESHELSVHLDQTQGLVVACYCAQWCETCKQYRPAFQALAQRWPQHTFVWIDIEECEPLLDDEEVENFPTLLLQGPGGNLFFGPMIPHIEQLEKLLERTDPNAHGSASGPGPLKQLLGI